MLLNVYSSLDNSQLIYILQIRIIYSYSNSNRPVTYFHWKIFALARIWTQDLPSTKPICYQLSYPGLDHFFNNLGVLFQRLDPDPLINVVTFSSFVFMRLTWASHRHDVKGTYFIIFQCFSSLWTMQTHAQAFVCWSKYTKHKT